MAKTRAARKPFTENKPKQAVSPDERRRMIAEAAYFRADKRGFTGGDPLGDWLAAEKQVDAMLPQRCR
jgi:hypothetical protein